MAKKNYNTDEQRFCAHCGKPMRAEKSSNVHRECLREALADTEIELKG